MSHLHHKTAQEEKVINSLLKIYDQKSGVFSHKRNFKFVEISNTLSDFLVSSQVMVRPDISCGVIDSSLSIIEYILNFYRYALYSHNSTLTEYETSISAIRWKSRLLTEHLSDINDVPNYSAYLQRINRLDTYINDILNFINSPQTISKSKGYPTLTEPRETSQIEIFLKVLRLAHKKTFEPPKPQNALQKIRNGVISLHQPHPESNAWEESTLSNHVLPANVIDKMQSYTLDLAVSLLADRPSILAAIAEQVEDDSIYSKNILTLNCAMTMVIKMSQCSSTPKEISEKNTAEKWVYLRTVLEETNKNRNSVKLLPVFVPAPEGISQNQLWRKLAYATSSEVITEASSSNECSVCLEAKFVTGKYAIFDNCTHILCIACTKKHFSESNLCPMCRRVIQTWTTKKEYKKFVKSQRRKNKYQGDLVEQNDRTLANRFKKLIF